MKLQSFSFLVILMQFYDTTSHFSLKEIQDFGIKNFDQYISHPCNRKCVKGEPPKVCRYNFSLEWYETLSKACFDCPTTISDCFRPHCVPADGVRRPIIVVNRMMPGPIIAVCKGDTIVVDVKNHLLGESTTIHWHGIHQIQTPFMDGTPHITQCPISPHSTFQYKFKATNAGTHWYHSHTGLQRMDGLFGALIVRESRDVEKSIMPEYDFDFNEHVLIVHDWLHVPAVTMFTTFHHSIGANKAESILVNGRGRVFGIWKDIKGREIKFRTPSKRDENVPFPIFNVVHGKRYRFRLINAGSLNCPIEMRIVGHYMEVFASDGYPFKVEKVNSLVSYGGERFDFILTTNQTPNDYLISFKGLLDCGENFLSLSQSGILRYLDRVSSKRDFIQSELFNQTSETQLNSLNKGTEEKSGIPIPMLEATIPDTPELLKPKTDFKFFVYFDFAGIDDPHFHITGLYGFNATEVRSRHALPQLNGITFELPAKPMLLDDDESNFCDLETLKRKGSDCRNYYCACTHVLKVPLNSSVELILVDEGQRYESNHPFHLHGMSFRVVGMQRLGTKTTIEEVIKLDEGGKIERKLKGAPLKDTVTVPDGGYTVLRFKADNPGFWILHCHLEFHAHLGMSLVFHVGNRSQIPPIPRNFPTCGDFTSDYNFD